MKRNLDERRLIEGCLANKRKAQSLLYKRYKSKMYAICLRYAATESRAQDFLQEGFIKIFRSLDQYRFEVPVEYWMKRVMVNACISELRRKKEPAQQAYELEQVAELADESPATTSVSGIQPEKVVQLIQALPEGYRTIFNLYALEGYTHPEIGQILNISPGTSRSQYARARKLLARQIDQLKMNCHEGHSI